MGLAHFDGFDGGLGVAEGLDSIILGSQNLEFREIGRSADMVTCTIRYVKVAMTSVQRGGS